MHFPPPLLYVVAIVGGWLLQRIWPLSIGGGSVRNALGWLFVLAGALLAASAIGLFWRRQTSMIIILLVPALVGVQQIVIVREELYLRRRFGAEYEAYMRRVRRWL